MPTDGSAARSPEGFVHPGIKIVPRLSGLFKTCLKFLIGDRDLKNRQNLPLSLRARCTRTHLLATAPFLYLQFYISLASVCPETRSWVYISAWWICLGWKEAKNYSTKCFSLMPSGEAVVCQAGKVNTEAVFARLVQGVGHLQCQLQSVSHRYPRRSVCCEWTHTRGRLYNNFGYQFSPVVF